jgi:hypothetical protein
MNFMENADISLLSPHFDMTVQNLTRIFSTFDRGCLVIVLSCDCPVFVFVFVFVVSLYRLVLLSRLVLPSFLTCLVWCGLSSCLVLFCVVLCYLVLSCVIVYYLGVCSVLFVLSSACSGGDFLEANGCVSCKGLRKGLSHMGIIFDNEVRSPPSHPSCVVLCCVVLSCPVLFRPSVVLSCLALPFLVLSLV